MDLFSIWHLLIILVIVVVFFGTSKLRNIGPDLGGAIKGFRSAMKDEAGKRDEEDEAPPEALASNKSRVIEAKATTATARPKAKSRSPRSRKG